MSGVEYMVALFLSMAAGLVAGFGFGWLHANAQRDRETLLECRLVAKRKDPTP